MRSRTIKATATLPFLEMAMTVLSRGWRCLIDRLVGILSALLVLLLAVFLAVMWGEGIEKYVAALLGLPRKSDLLKFVGIAMGGILVALQALASHRRAKAMEESATAQAEATREQAKANLNTERGQRQERLKNAIEHLGHASDSVRLGGAYELFHLAQDNEELRQTVLDVLCAHLRRTTGERTYREHHASEPSEEVRSLLNLLFVQEHGVFKDLRIDLQGSWLNGADLAQARLQKAFLLGVHLQGAELLWAHLQEASLAHACLHKARLLGTCLQKANLFEADLQEADLSSVHLQDARLQKANLQDADLHGANLEGAACSGANLQGANLRGTQLQKASFIAARLPGVDLGGMRLRRMDFYGADLRGAILQGAHLQEAKLEKACLQEADLSGACLPDADLREADLRGADLAGACLQGAKLHRARLQGAGLGAACLQGAGLTGACLQGAELRDGFLQGANLFDTQLQGADLAGAHLQGTRNESERSLDEQVMGDFLFADRLRNRIGRQSDLSGATFEGGLTRADLDALVEGWSDEKARRLREMLAPHLDRPAIHRLPEGSGAVVGVYTGAEAEQWIAGYQDAMSELPLGYPAHRKR